MHILQGLHTESCPDGAAPTGLCNCRLEEEKGIRIRFTTGLVPDEYKDEIAEEESKYGEFLRIPIKVSHRPTHPCHMQD